MIRQAGFSADPSLIFTLLNPVLPHTMAHLQGRILVIDDDEGILTTVRILLRKAFAEIVTEHTPQKITQLLHQQHFHVIILDMDFSAGATSGKEGFYWLRQIRELAPESKVIMMTAYGDIDLAIKAMKDGATDFVIKPWENEKLIQTVTDAFRQSQMVQLPDISSAPTPAQEVTRIFMFLDIKSSTGIAEQLGHVRYFELLNDFFADIIEPIVAHEGKIYQYVGDEVVVSWPVETGVSEANCLQCFFAICDKVSMLASGYQEKYGMAPTFKAGMHYGPVTCGAIGTVKKEIVFSGDVLNTTSRLEGLCNRYQVDLLVSKALLDLLPAGKDYASRELGDIQLRGRKQHITLMHVQRAMQT
jgi:class 3 adenylate cyclase